MRACTASGGYCGFTVMHQHSRCDARRHPQLQRRRYFHHHRWSGARNLGNHGLVTPFGTPPGTKSVHARCGPPQMPPRRAPSTSFSGIWLGSRSTLSSALGLSCDVAVWLCKPAPARRSGRRRWSLQHVRPKLLRQRLRVDETATTPARQSHRLQSRTTPLLGHVLRGRLPAPESNRLSSNMIAAPFGYHYRHRGDQVCSINTQSSARVVVEP